MMYKKITTSNNEAIRVDTLSKADKAKALNKKADENQAAKDLVPPQIDPNTFEFPVNCKFFMGGNLYTVVKVHRDSNTEWRTIISAVDQDQDFMLTTLRKDASGDSNFTVVELGNDGKRDISNIKVN